MASLSSEEIFKLLAEEFPEMYKGFKSEYGMFYLSAGWLPIVQDLSRFISNEIKTDEILRESFKMIQVKEKFGTLRFYADYQSSSNKVSNAILNCEKLSTKTCVICGGEKKDSKLRDFISNFNFNFTGSFSGAGMGAPLCLKHFALRFFYKNGPMNNINDFLYCGRS